MQDYISIIEKAIKENPISGSPAQLYDPVNYIMQLGGKRVRPVLALIGYEMFAGKIDEKAINLALAIEVFHNFTLMHDDIMDNAPVRRGKQTVHLKWNSSTALLAGDNMLIKAYGLLAKNDTSVLKPLLEIFNRTASEVCEGQQLDMDFELLSSVSEDEYIEMITLKTAVLLGCSLSMGAIAAGANEEQIKHLFEYGKDMGIAFQLMDDYLDAYGDHQKVGKQKGGDIISNKKTYLYIKALEKADGEVKERLNFLFGNSTMNSDDKIKEVLSIFSFLEIEKEIKDKIRSYEVKASDHLQFSGFENVNLEFLIQLSQSLKGREF
ncbi:MAG: polyprenyl synthetase family protein [Bacteroidia bacterium]|nr:polyprenyl synthetase family protein [Bacteroidia bacterium]